MTFIFSDYAYMGGNFYRNVTRIHRQAPLPSLPDCVCVQVQHLAIHNMCTGAYPVDQFAMWRCHVCRCLHLAEQLDCCFVCARLRHSIQFNRYSAWREKTVSGRWPSLPARQHLPFPSSFPQHLWALKQGTPRHAISVVPSKTFHPNILSDMRFHES